MFYNYYHSITIDRYQRRSHIAIDIKYYNYSMNTGYAIRDQHAYIRTDRSLLYIITLPILRKNRE